MSKAATGEIARPDFSKIHSFVENGPGAVSPDRSELPSSVEVPRILVRHQSAIERVLPDYVEKEQRGKVVHSTFDLPHGLQRKLKMYANLLELPMHKIVTIAVERELHRLREKLPEELNL